MPEGIYILGKYALGRLNMAVLEKSGNGVKTAWVAAMLILGLAARSPAQEQAARPSNLRKVLVLDKNQGGSNGFKESREHLKGALAELAAAHGFEVTILGQEMTADSIAAALSPASLAGYQAVIFDYNDGVDHSVKESARPGFEDWIRNGGALIAIHEASAFITNWPFLTESLVECFYGPHGNNQPKANLYHDSEGLAEGSETRGILQGLNAPSAFLDLFISFRHSPRGQPGVTILTTLDEKSYTQPINGPMGEDHPVVWTKAVGKGKVIHNSLGYSWQSPNPNVYAQSDGYLKKLLYNLMRYAAGDFIGCTDTHYMEYNPDATKSDPAACKTILASAILTAPQGIREPVLAFHRGANSLLIQFQSGGEHEVILMDIGGKRLLRRTGIGAAGYTLALPGKAGVYLVRTTVGGKSRTQRLSII